MPSTWSPGRHRSEPSRPKETAFTAASWPTRNTSHQGALTPELRSPDRLSHRPTTRGTPSSPQLTHASSHRRQQSGHKATHPSDLPSSSRHGSTPADLALPLRWPRAIPPARLTRDSPRPHPLPTPAPRRPVAPPLASHRRAAGYIQDLTKWSGATGHATRTPTPHGQCTTLSHDLLPTPDAKSSRRRPSPLSSRGFVSFQAAPGYTEDTPRCSPQRESPLEGRECADTRPSARPFHPPASPRLLHQVTVHRHALLLHVNLAVLRTPCRHCQLWNRLRYAIHQK